MLTQFLKFQFGTSKRLKIQTSPLAGEVGFQYEQRSASIRKAGEGWCNKHAIFYPSPFFLRLVPHLEKSPLPQGARMFERLMQMNLIFAEVLC